MYPNLFIKHATVNMQTCVFRRKNWACEVKQLDDKCSQYETPFSGAFTKFQNATLSLSVCLSISLSIHTSVHMENLASRWTELHETLYLRILRK
jgi:hypothetical protein